MLFNFWSAVSYKSSKSSQLVKRWVSSATKMALWLYIHQANQLYICKKQQWPWNRPLKNTTFNWLGWWLYTIIGYILWSIRQVTLKPIISKTSNAIMKQILRSISWSTMSKAFEKSKYIPIAVLPSPSTLDSLPWRIKWAKCVECYFLNPNRYPYKMSNFQAIHVSDCT